MSRAPNIALIVSIVALVCGCQATTHSVPTVSSNTTPLARSPSKSGVFGNTLCLNADLASGDNLYAHIERVLGAGAVESPSDGVYEPARAHVLRIADDPLVGAHFAIEAIEPTDVNQDLVPLSRGGDRSRTEIKIAPSKQGMHDAFKAKEDDTYVYAWRFRISPTMKFSSSFTHIHQIKAYGGEFSDPPLITFTPLVNGNMEVRHVGDMQKNAAQSQLLGTVPLSNIVGQWLDVREEITYSNTNGRYQLLIRDDQGRPQLSIERNNLVMWRTGAEHMRHKWGIYRRHSASLNQHIADTVYFANFAITRGLNPTLANSKDAIIDGSFESKCR